MVQEPNILGPDLTKTEQELESFLPDLNIIAKSKVDEVDIADSVLQMAKSGIEIEGTELHMMEPAVEIERSGLEQEVEIARTELGIEGTALVIMEPEIKIGRKEPELEIEGMELQMAESEIIEARNTVVDVTELEGQNARHELDIAGMGEDIAVIGQNLEIQESLLEMTAEQSEEEPFQDSGSEYRPSSSSDSETEQHAGGKKIPEKVKDKVILPNGNDARVTQKGFMGMSTLGLRSSLQESANRLLKGKHEKCRPVVMDTI